MALQPVCVKPFRKRARWPSSRVSDSVARGGGFDTHLPGVVSLSKDTPRKVLVIPRKRWHSPDMTKIFDWDVDHQHIQTKIFRNPEDRFSRILTITSNVTLHFQFAQVDKEFDIMIIHNDCLYREISSKR